MKPLTAVAMLLIASVPIRAWADSGPAAVEQVLAPDGRPCTFFRLTGVSQASPARQSDWFAVNQNFSGYKESITMLVAALTSGRTIYVETTGSLDPACGEAQVSRVFIQ